MEALAWNFLISSMFSMLTKYSCQVQPNHNTTPLRPIILLPAPSGISYEALQYPVPMEPYQLVPLVINTGKIPLINHAVQAPIQYFVPNSENQQRVASRNSVKYSTAPAHNEQRSTTQHSPKPYMNARTENQPTYKYYPTTMYSETRVEGQPASQYSYGYKIIDGNSNNQHESRDNGNVSGSYSLAKPDNSKRVSEHGTANPRDQSTTTTVRGGQNADKQGKQDGSNKSKTLKPIVVVSDTKTRKTELKKRYKYAKNATKLATPINAANENGFLTTLKP